MARVNFVWLVGEAAVPPPTAGTSAPMTSGSLRWPMVANLIGFSRSQRPVAVVHKVGILVAGLVTAALGVLTVFYPLISFYPFLGEYIPNSFLKSVHYFNTVGQGGLCFATRPSSSYANCPAYLYFLPSPLDTVPIVPLVFIVVGLLTAGSVITRLPGWLKVLFLSMSVGLILVLVTSEFGYLAQGWPVRWILYSPRHVPAQTYETVYLDVLTFALNWFVFTALVFLIVEPVHRALYHSWRLEV